MFQNTANSRHVKRPEKPTKWVPVVKYGPILAKMIVMKYIPYTRTRKHESMVI